MPSIDKTNKALYELLAADSALMALATGGVWDGKPDDGTALPYAVFQRVTGVPDYTAGLVLSSEKQVYMLKGYAADRPTAALIVDRLKIVTRNANLVIEGSSLLACYPTTDLPLLPEPASTTRSFETYGEGCYLEIFAA